MEISFAEATAVPPVAIKSSIIKTLSREVIALLWIWISSLPYSREYFCRRTLPGSFPFFLIGTKGRSSLKATAAPKMKPLASTPAIFVNFRLLAYFEISLITSVNNFLLSVMEVMSWKRIPFFGKLGITRIFFFNLFTSFLFDV